ncbi:DUF2202 domain-containing protein [uncultured Draconibacterium sp.]|uniref:DUF2202 domain-containing protein n=1 Tax=uncultured Draconibacterium sp. TaxID=1573823 RepID=UPI003217D17B
MKTVFFFFLMAVAILPKLVECNELSDAQKQGLQLMREEEKLAHDVYLVLYEKWELPVFRNISNSESRHFDAVGYLLETYDVKDIAFSEPGKFQNQDIAALYETLVTKGAKSLQDALEVGAYIEEVDIKDLQEQLDLNPDETIAVVFGNLLRASGNHLRAFTGQLSSRYGEYRPVVLSSEVYATIVDSQFERGNRGNCVVPQGNCNNQQVNKPKRMRNRGNRNRCSNN